MQIWFTSKLLLFSGDFSDLSMCLPGTTECDVSDVSPACQLLYCDHIYMTTYEYFALHRLVCSFIPEETNAAKTF